MRLSRFCLLFWLLILSGSAVAERVLSFAIVPQQSTATLAKTWGPVLAWLSQDSGISLSFATTKDISTFEQKLAAGDFDFAYMNPYHFTVYNQNPGYRALARAKGETIKGILVVHKDSPVKKINDLAGNTLVFPSPAAFAASLLVRAELRRNGVQFQPKYVSSHNSVYMNVARGFYPAGGGVPRTFGMLDAQYRDDLRVLWESRPYTTHAIAYRSTMDPAVAQRVWSAMQKMSRDPVGLSLLKGIGFAGFEAADDADWNDVRQLGIRPEDSGIIQEPD
ncbi:MAG: phosphate/phosphite/phosphonate ABC transporter substrate-binding protein [Gallionella sp.]|jgi:phosphonate transport system substrate-binding protein|nr:phosphate/phosphite/phosphonate ABC transporter substrate-binding protein [Gallionella sp.]